MNILIATWIYPKVSESFIHEPAAWLQEEGHGVRVVSERLGTLTEGEAPGVEGEVLGDWLPRRRKLGLILRNPGKAALRSSRIRRLGESVSSAESLARSFLPQVRWADRILVHYGTMARRWLGAAAAANLPMAVFFHGYDATKTPLQQPHGYRSLYASGVPLLANSPYLRDRLLADGAPADRVKVLRLAASPRFFLPEEENAPGPTITTVGRLVEKKGLQDSIRAFAQAQDVLAGEWRYQIIGDGEMRAELESMAASLGLGALVLFRGSCSREVLREALRTSSVFCLASRTARDGDTEGTPIALMEGALAWNAVVSTKHAGIPDMLPPDAEDRGFLVAEGDVNALARAFRTLAGDQDGLAEWARTCALFAQERFARRRFLRELTELLDMEARVPRVDKT